MEATIGRIHPPHQLGGKDLNLINSMLGIQSQLMNK